MSDLDRALSEIADIRAQLAASTHFRGIAPELNALTGAMALVVAAMQSLLPQWLARDGLHFIAVWGTFMTVSAVLNSSQAVSRARRAHGAMAHAMLGAAVQKILPFAAAAAVITCVICTLAPGSAWLLPGLWQLLIGLAGFTALSSLPGTIVWPALWYFLCGTGVLALGAWREELSPWMMGIPFGIGQMAVAVVLYQASREGVDHGQG